MKKEKTETIRFELPADVAKVVKKAAKRNGFGTTPSELVAMYIIGRVRNGVF
jgi:hypothetical protein